MKLIFAKRIATNVLICGYLGALGFGLVSHAVKLGNGAHPIMYFVVWDMFWGWSGYEQRYHVVGEGESGEFYRLTPPPWGEFKAYGNIGRQHQDFTGKALIRMAQNTLAHTTHEPMTRLLVVEESWNKKYNLPDNMWNARYDAPKDLQSHFWVRASHTPDGQLRESSLSWLAHLQSQSVLSNPRLASEHRKTTPYVPVNSHQRRAATLGEVTAIEPAADGAGL